MDRETLMRLKKLAQKATPAPWEALIANECRYITGRDGDDDGRKFVASRIHECPDHAYIAAANPQAILELLTACERLEKEADWLAGALENFVSPLESASSWREAARKAVEEK